MDLSSIIQMGMVHQDSFVVQEKHLARQVGSGSVRVLSTPTLISFMEITCHMLLAKYLPQGYSSVGVLVNVRHLAPTPPRVAVHVRAEVQHIEGLKVTFSVKAWDAIGGADELIGEGLHERFVIDEARFLKRVEEKIAQTRRILR